MEGGELGWDVNNPISRKIFLMKIFLSNEVVSKYMATTALIELSVLISVSINTKKSYFL